MFSISQEALNKIFNDDTIYHYTKASTAIDYILHKNQLRFNGTVTSSDPIESEKAHRGTVAFGNLIGAERSKNVDDDLRELHEYVEELETTFNMVCFCKNSTCESSMYGFEGNEELYGFTKMRMWDQYADRFSGVCIALSKEKILELNNGLELIEKDVEYFKLRELCTRKVSYIQENHLIKVGIDEYKKLIKSILEERSFFSKHTDYSGENEYRIGTYFKTEKCTIERVKNEYHFDRTMMLNIENCIKCIFVSSFANDKQKSDLLNYSDKLGIDLFEIDWKYDSFKVRNVKQEKLFYENLSPTSGTS
ncbi:DUF2971 domain-containing protein [Sphingobacterium sp. UT-1RO-CII-1]|uniref:DUF2971 domain-containing protein n=1 Tax=Sphingobacterium sp. UT-1RO-CII-1 TaxID=2995225 RepID=UPI00227AB00F|nr:DUF2971 domain-containing protein [Sphingobacterium sp. UT-1RO-CII-1]MCY4781652.1 DUF2971 domain-containing protein [Sphingobacterium sp. UT-1RO-CII-1]